MADHTVLNDRRSFARLASAISRYYEAAAARLDLNGADVDCLVLLDLEEAATAGRLADLTGLTTGGITGVLDRLERVGLVVREADPEDRRRVVVRITAGAAARLQAVLALPGLLAAASAEGTVNAAFAQRAAEAIENEIAALRAGDPQPVSQGEDGTISVPMTDGSEAWLEIAGGANRIDLTAAPLTDRLIVARLLEGSARVSVDGPRVRISGRRLGFGRGGATAIELSTAVRWNIAIRGGANVIDAAIGGLRLRELSIAGGVTSGTVDLGIPEGSSAVRLSGGASTLVLRRPPEVPIRLRRAGGMGDVRVDGSTVASGSRIEWQSPGFANATGRYDISIRGGITRLTIEESDGGPA